MPSPLVLGFEILFSVDRASNAECRGTIRSGKRAVCLCFWFLGGARWPAFPGWCKALVHRELLLCPWSSFSAQRSRLVSLHVSVCGSCPGACTTASWQFICLTLSPPRLGVAERKMGFIQPCVPHRLVSSLSSESRFKKNVFH